MLRHIVCFFVAISYCFSAPISLMETLRRDVLLKSDKDTVSGGDNVQLNTTVSVGDDIILNKSNFGSLFEYFIYHILFILRC